MPSSHAQQTLLFVGIACANVVLDGCSEAPQPSLSNSATSRKPVRSSEEKDARVEAVMPSPTTASTNPQSVSPAPLSDDLLSTIDRRKPAAVEHRERAMAALQREDWKLAAVEFQAALDIDPERDELYYGLAMARFRLREWGAATTLLNRILLRHPNDPAALELLGIVELFERRYSSSIRHLTASIEAGREGSTVYSMRARAHLESGDPEEALADTDRAIRAGSQDAGLYLLRCAAAIRLKRTYEAREALQTAERLGAPPKSLESLTQSLNRLSQQ